jgi:peptide/nickel transport system substrate-binding protein
LTFALAAFPATLSEREGGVPVVSQLHSIGDALLGQDGSGKIGPRLATSWKLIDDRTWEFKLRPGVKFHNGEPFTSQSVKFTYERVIDPKNKFSRAVRLSLVTGVETPDELTVRVKTSAPFPLLPFGVSQIPIQPAAYFTQVGEAAYEAKPIGTGPFKLVEWTPNQRIVYEANKEYWGDKAFIDKLIFKYIPDASTRLAALQAGEVDIMNQVPIDVATTLDTATTKLASVNVAAGLTFTFNLLEEGPLRDLRVRQAIDMAIDRETLFKSLYKGYGAVLDGQITTAGSVGYNPALKRTNYDPEGAKRLLAAAGFATGLSFELNAPVNKYAADRDITLAVAAQLKAVGIQANPNVMEYATFSGLASTKKLKGMHLIGWYNLGDAESAMTQFLSTSPYGYWSFPEFDSTLTKARSELDAPKREELLRQSAVILQRELPGAMMLQFPSLYGVNKRVKGFSPRSDEYVIDLNKVSLE